MAQVNVDKGLFMDAASGEFKEGYRDPTTHVVVFDDAEDKDVSGAVVDVEVAEPEKVQVESRDFSSAADEEGEAAPEGEAAQQQPDQQSGLTPEEARAQLEAERQQQQG